MKKVVLLSIVFLSFIATGNAQINAKYKQEQNGEKVILYLYDDGTCIAKHYSDDSLVLRGEGEYTMTGTNRSGSIKISWEDGTSNRGKFFISSNRRLKLSIEDAIYVYFR